jgi:hypothetical protein
MGALAPNQLTRVPQSTLVFSAWTFFTLFILCCYHVPLLLSMCGTLAPIQNSYRSKRQLWPPRLELCLCNTVFWYVVLSFLFRLVVCCYLMSKPTLSLRYHSEGTAKFIATLHSSSVTVPCRSRSGTVSYRLIQLPLNSVTCFFLLGLFVGPTWAIHS